MSEQPSRLPPLRSGDPRYQELEAALKGSRGRVPTPFRIWMESPELARCLQPLGAFLANATSLSKIETELVILFVARHWHAAYVFEAHAVEAAQAGMAPDAIALLRRGGIPAGDDPRWRCIHRLLSTLDDGARFDDTAFDDAVTILGHRGMAEVLAIAGYFTSVGLAMRLYEVPVPQAPG